MLVKDNAWDKAGQRPVIWVIFTEGVFAGVALWFSISLEHRDSSMARLFRALFLLPILLFSVLAYYLGTVGFPAETVLAFGFGGLASGLVIGVTLKHWLFESRVGS
jgi:hypothetical protein